jgi:DNA-binding transcriptional MerR regulator
VTPTTLLPAAPETPSDAPAERSYTVGEAARMTGLSEHTLRYYERARLIRPVRRERSSRHRRYSAEDLGRLHTLACLRAAGMPVDGMRRYFELVDQGATAAPLQYAMLQEQRGVLEQRMRELRGHLEYLDRKIEYWRAVEAGDASAAAEIADRLFRSFSCTNPREP